MKRVMQEIINPDIVWVANVNPQVMKGVLANLIDKEVNGFHVSDDRGGSGGWKIRFDVDYDEEQVRNFMERISDLDWILTEVADNMII